LRGVRAQRDEVGAARRLESLREASRTYAINGAKRPPLMELIIDAVRARASVGEIADALRDEWGTYRPS
jgi:methylmalonyl-CoA mutase, N-terminal domain